MNSGRPSSATNQGSSPHDSFMAFIVDDDSLSTLRLWAERQGYASAVVQQGGPDMFAQTLESTRPPALAVLDVDGQVDPVNAVARLVALCGPDSKLVVIGSINDVGFYRRILSLGVVDYLVKPITNDSLHQTLQSALRNNKSATPGVKEAKTIVVVGVRGGVGASTIAINTGWLLAHEMGFKCTLLDLDLQFGTSALALDLQPGRGLRDIVSSPHRVDNLMISSSMVEESDHFSVLGGEEPLDEQIPIDGAAITAMLGEIKNKFDYIIVDLPRHLLSSQKRLLMTADTIVLATELSLAGIRDTRRVKSTLSTLGFSGQLICLATRTSSTRPGQVDVASFEKGSQIKIDLTVPEDAKTMTETANSGKALGAISKSSSITKALMALCHKISATAPAVDKPPQDLLQKCIAFLKTQKLRILS